MDGIFVLARDLVDLVDVDDSLHAAFPVATSRLQQLEDDVLDVLTDITRFGQRGCVDNGERNRQHPGQSLGQQSLSGAGRADQQDVALAQLHVLMTTATDLDSLVVIVDGDGQLLLGQILPDDVLIEECS